MTDKATELAEKLAVLKETYISQLGERIENLESAYQDINSGNDFATTKGGLEQLAFHAHKLAGTAGTFGFADLGEIGAEIEQKCDTFITDQSSPSDEDKGKLEEMVATCRTLAEA